MLLLLLLEFGEGTTPFNSCGGLRLGGGGDLLNMNSSGLSICFEILGSGLVFVETSAY